jgi:hypothetical protein
MTAAEHEARELAKTAFTKTVLASDGREAALDAALDTYQAALAAAGYLTLPGRQPTPDELDRSAQWLAAQSCFPRYVATVDGWRALRRDPRHVIVAYNKAVDQLGAGEDTLAAALAAAKALLIQHACEGSETTTEADT